MARIISLSFAIFICFIGPTYAQDKYDKVQIKTTKLDDGIYMLQGAGGNMGVSAGEDGVFLIDDQFSPLTPKIIKAISDISTQPIKFLLNTHWHFDHTGGNENLGNMGAVIVAQDNVYKRLSAGQFMEAMKRDVPPAPKAALPVISFSDEMTFHLNGLHILVHHYAHAHTDGDSVIFFKNKNIVHTGDIFFNGFYPFIDSGSGGSIYGVIDAAADILKQIDDNTKIIPGHGPLANKKDLQNYRNMLTHVVKSLTPLAQKGISLNDAIKSDPLKELNAQWGHGFLKPDKFLALVYPVIQAHNKK